VRPQEEGLLAADFRFSNFSLKIRFGPCGVKPSGQFLEHRKSDVMACALVFSAWIAQPHDEFHGMQGSGLGVQFLECRTIAKNRNPNLEIRNNFKNSKSNITRWSYQLAVSNFRFDSDLF
jgi:hypothetical protein